MKLENTYAIGTLVMFYEIEMLEEYVDGILNMCSDVENHENVTFHFTLNMQEYLESVNETEKSKKAITENFFEAVKRLQLANFNVIAQTKDNTDAFYNIAQYRRDLNYKYCELVDFIIWGETDSLFPKEGLQVIERVSDHATKQGISRFLLTFAYRVNWDRSWDILKHVKFEDTLFLDNKHWTMNDEASSKSYMTIERMNEINAEYTKDGFDVRMISYPKFDGSLLVINTNVIKMGINIPHALLHCAEDTSFGYMCQKVMGDRYVQFIAKNVLRVHNRRHPNKRNYILNEDNPHGFAGTQKGEWWNILEKSSKYNLSILDSQKPFISMNELMENIKKSRDDNQSQ